MSRYRYKNKPAERAIYKTNDIKIGTDECVFVSTFLVTIYAVSFNASVIMLSKPHNLDLDEISSDEETSEIQSILRRANGTNPSTSVEIPRRNIKQAPTTLWTSDNVKFKLCYYILFVAIKNARTYFIMFYCFS